VRRARDRGQTVLLSSHILSEVEAVCDRVAMLGTGRIIDAGTLDALKGYAALRVRAHFSSGVPELSGIAGVSNVVTGLVLWGSGWLHLERRGCLAIEADSSNGARRSTGMPRPSAYIDR
jgi:ABC-type uncharacterized transport system ATPase subunit